MIAPREIFINLLPEDVAFLGEDGVPLLEEQCPRFDCSIAIEQLERRNRDDFEANWNRGDFDPAALLEWFDGNKTELDRELRQRLASISVFPSAGELHSLKDLYLPGGFEDPIGVADLVEIGKLEGLSDFLRSLGAAELTFQDYAKDRIPAAFADSDTSTDTKRKLLDLLAEHIGEIKGNERLKGKLAGVDIVECADGEFQRPAHVYFPCNEVQRVFGRHVSYARVSEKSEVRTDLYRWLGVASRPRPHDVIQFIDELTSKPPNQDSVRRLKEILEALGTSFPTLSEHDKGCYDALQSIEWMPSEGDSSRWHKPDQLYAAYNRGLFESQAKFLDLSVPIQQKISDFLEYLGVNRSPTPFQVVRHLLKCVEEGQAPPNGLYHWLNENAQPSHLLKLRNEACLRIQGKYVRPDQVFWGRHGFGRFRFQLGDDFGSYQKLLRALDIKETPDHADAIEVLSEIGEEVGGSQLKPEDKNVVLQCWMMLEDALQDKVLDAETMKACLHDARCVPKTQNDIEMLDMPSRMFFEDRPGYGSKFELIRWNLIPRYERISVAMAAAGVKPVSQVVKGEIENATDAREDERLGELIADRKLLIETLLGSTSNDDAVPLSGIGFLRAKKLMVKWQLQAFGRTETTIPELESAHLDRHQKAIYFAAQNGNTPWSAIARELTQAIALGVEVKSISPGLKTVLEAPTYKNAVAQLEDLGIPVTEELKVEAVRGNVVDAFDEPPLPKPPLDTPVTGQNGATEADSGTRSPAEPIAPQDGANSGTDTSQTPLDETPDGMQPNSRRSQEAERNGPAKLFAELLWEVQTVSPLKAPDKPIMLPGAGTKTGESAQADIELSHEVGRSGAHVPKSVKRWQPTEASKELKDRFRSMEEGDYDKRCQICGTTFATRKWRRPGVRSSRRAPSEG